MEIVLVRHGPARARDPARWPDDGQRPLTAEGRAATRAAARGLRRAGVDAPRIATSPLLRARATAEILSAELGGRGAIEAWEELAPGATAEAVVRRLGARRHAPGTVLLVGHEPSLGLLAGLLLTGEEVRPFRLAKAGAARLRAPRALRGGAVLDWLLSRKQLIRLGA